MRCKHAVLDHLSMATCAGFEGGSFSEVQEVWRDLAVPWAGAFGDACSAHPIAVEATLAHGDEPLSAGELSDRRDSSSSTGLTRRSRFLGVCALLSLMENFDVTASRIAFCA